jgi:DNA-binding transcriptional regulator YhcF (GntR family)
MEAGHSGHKLRQHAGNREGGMRQSKSERQARIVSELRAAPALRVNDLADRLDVSTETVRRDFTELEERGLINRTYGGAMRPMSLEPALAEREQLMVAERERIASCAVQLVEDNDILMIGGGATTLHFARQAGGGTQPPHDHHPCLLHCRGTGQQSPAQGADAAGTV